MRSTLDRARHLTDADLVGVVDGMDGMDGMEEASLVAAHLLECSACASRLVIVKSRLARLTVVLREADSAIGATSPPHVSMETLDERAAARRLYRAHRTVSARISIVHSHRWLGAAAAVLLFAGAATAAVPALRGWVAARWAQVATPGATVRRTALPVSESPAAPLQQRGAVVSFHPLGDEFVIRFDKPPAGGVLVLSRVAGVASTSMSTAASAEIIRGGTTDELVVLPRELRIRNSASSVADYRVVLPASVHSVRIVFGNGPSERGSVVALPASVREEISLGKRPVR